jgi:hypothetical protein
VNELELVDWRRQVSALYVAVRGEGCAETAHARWRTGLDTLLREHPRSPLEPSDRLRTTGMSYSSGGLSVDLNFLYHPPCPYSSEWQCPLAPAGNTIAFRVRGGEQGNRALLATCHWKSGRLHDVDSSAGSCWSRGIASGAPRLSRVRALRSERSIQRCLIDPLDLDELVARMLATNDHHS